MSRQFVYFKALSRTAKPGVIATPTDPGSVAGYAKSLAVLHNGY